MKWREGERSNEEVIKMKRDEKKEGLIGVFLERREVGSLKAGWRWLS